QHKDVAVNRAGCSGPGVALRVVSAAGDEKDIFLGTGKDTGQPGVFRLAMPGREIGYFLPLNPGWSVNGVGRFGVGSPRVPRHDSGKSEEGEEAWQQAVHGPHLCP